MAESYEPTTKKLEIVDGTTKKVKVVFEKN